MEIKVGDEAGRLTALAQGRLCERLRMPAMTTARHTPTAGVRKRPMDEIAGEGTREGAAFAMGIGQPRMRRSSGPDAIGRVAA